MISEAPLNGAKSFAIHFSVWIDEVIERLSPLLRLKDQIATDGELDAVLIMRAEEVFAFGRPASKDLSNFAVTKSVAPFTNDQSNYETAHGTQN